MTQHDAGRGVNYAGIGSISNPASRCVSVASYCEPALNCEIKFHAKFSGYTVYHVKSMISRLHIHVHVHDQSIACTCTCVCINLSPPQQSLMSTIVNLAQTFVGSNNVNLLQPLGQFGTRLHGGKDAASAR